MIRVYIVSRSLIGFVLSTSLKTFSLKSDTGIDLVIFSFDGDTNTADIRLNNQMEQVELATHNEEDYYESYAVNPFSRRSDFVVGIRRDPECIQVSVSVANRLVTWRLDKVPNLAVAQLVVSGELAVTKTTYVLPQQYAIQTHLEKGVYVKRTGQRIFKDDCYIPRKIQLQGTAPRYANHSHSKELIDCLTSLSLQHNSK